ncbi:MAG: hypothetical protein ACD_81C00091G0004 [uncultured bacterium]|uniref:Inorganic pyrophosphatase n=2 Tax=Candidatus Wolfeibacteriota TaxID=1752735 RepID=A0A0G1H9N0_9BACT|nr:MAG: hypothetical protein ACD_81C00091G0004 [uncultured bacterium]KKR12539.1 MAG: Inorganic pyrophosphatase [Candidatus Wolfebacteria bacterium GW2011_GWC2_39_22]KKT43495.1 MAG: Inorganic pyrophosphatase [Candidatus Wolfebacteria bacterium GW2011_GWE2_44_13]HBI25742.1 inorganic diphosphatase [Candidatus Wolfebacteria bacterium]
MNFEALGAGEKAPEIVTVVVEIPKGSHNKYEYDEETGVFKLDRVLYSPMHYPLDYGFIPQTRSEDGDHLDALIIGSDPVFTGCVVNMRPIAVFHMVDSGEADAKILGVQANNPRFDSIKDLADVELHSPHLLKEISHFFKVYKDLQGKEVHIQGWENKAAAIAEIEKSQKAYK